MKNQNSIHGAVRPGRKGSTILVVMGFLVIISLILGSALELSSNTGRIANASWQYNTAKAVAEGELEAMFYRWRQSMQLEQVYSAMREAVEVTGPSSETWNSMFDSDKYSVTATLTAVDGDLTDDRPDTPIEGILPGSNAASTRAGTISTYEAVVRVQTTGGSKPLDISLGRRFVKVSSQIYNNAIFYQGDLEFNPAGSPTINGPIHSNGEMWLSANKGTAANPGKLGISSTVTFVEKLNGDSAGIKDLQLQNPALFTNINAAKTSDADTKRAPEFLTQTDNDGNPIYPQAVDAGGNPMVDGDGQPIFDTSGAPLTLRPDQVAQVPSADLLGGVDPVQVLNDYGDRFDHSMNEVFRSLVAPPPVAGDVPVISEQRAFNKAGLMITVVNNSGTKVIITDSKGTIYPHSGVWKDAIPTTRKSVRDAREARNVNTTIIDVGKLQTAIANTPGLSDFNGVLYFTDEINKTGSTNRNAVRLENGSNLSGFVDGFTVATDVGLYVKGDYNTGGTGSAIPSNVNAPADGDDTANAGYEPVPASLLADAVTALSSNWNDANASKALNTRIAKSTTINAAVLSGNVPTPDVANKANKSSGGAQNLIRFLEDWYEGHSFTLNGSLGQLFNSRYFRGVFVDQSAAGAPYGAPTRHFIYNEDFKSKPPPGSPAETIYSRGDYFFN